MHFYHHLYIYGKTSQSVTHLKIIPGQTRLTLEFFTVELSEEKNVYLSVMSIISILLSLEPRCHNSPL
jgi:hypothetical protein